MNNIKRRHVLVVAINAVLFLGALQPVCLAADAFEPSAKPPGAIRHRESGFVFPRQLGSFQRGEPHQFDTAGHDISVAYNSGAGVVATIYVYPTGGLTLEQEFARRQAEIAAAHPDAKMLAHEATTVTPRRVRALSASYLFSGNFGGTTQSLHSILLVGQSGNRFVEYRITYPVSAGQEATAAAVMLAKTFAWP